MAQCGVIHPCCRDRLVYTCFFFVVPRISQDMFEVFFADMIYQYSFDSSVSVWHFMLLNVFFWFTYQSFNAVSLRP